MGQILETLALPGLRRQAQAWALLKKSSLSLDEPLNFNP